MGLAICLFGCFLSSGDWRGKANLSSEWISKSRLLVNSRRTLTKPADGRNNPDLRGFYRKHTTHRPLRQRMIERQPHPRAVAAQSLKRGRIIELATLLDRRRPHRRVETRINSKIAGRTASAEEPRLRTSSMCPPETIL